MFRVLQEALHNAVKHSGVKQIDVQLEQSNEVDLIVSDPGRGFDVESAMGGHGLGLTSMRERVRLVDGTINIESKPMVGTTIHVRVPFQVTWHWRLGEEGAKPALPNWAKTAAGYWQARRRYHRGHRQPWLADRR